MENNRVENILIKSNINIMNCDLNKAESCSSWATTNIICKTKCAKNVQDFLAVIYLGIAAQTILFHAQACGPLQLGIRKLILYNK